MAIVNLQFQRSDSQKLIFIDMVVIVGAALVERYSGVKETASLPEIFTGAFIATTLLLLLSYILPEFAVGLATIAAVGMVISKGEPFWSALAKIEPPIKTNQGAAASVTTSTLQTQVGSIGGSSVGR